MLYLCYGTIFDCNSTRTYILPNACDASKTSFLFDTSRRSSSKPTGCHKGIWFSHKFKQQNHPNNGESLPRWRGCRKSLFCFPVFLWHCWKEACLPSHIWRNNKSSGSSYPSTAKGCAKFTAIIFLCVSTTIVFNSYSHAAAARNRYDPHTHNSMAL